MRRPLSVQAGAAPPFLISKVNPLRTRALLSYIWQSRIVLSSVLLRSYAVMINFFPHRKRLNARKEMANEFETVSDQPRILRNPHNMSHQCSRANYHAFVKFPLKDEMRFPQTCSE